MKPFFRRAAAAVLACAVLIPSAFASEALGSRLYGYTIPICGGTTLTREVMWSASHSDLRTENYVTYSPNSAVSPKVSYGSTVLSRQTVYSMAKNLEGQGDRVLSGVNGDYFVMASGSPLGLVVTDGVLRSSASYLSAIGFKKDGTAVAGKPELKLRANFAGYSLKIEEINKTREGYGYFLYTDDFGPDTKTSRPGIDVVLTPTGTPVQSSDSGLAVSTELGIGKRVPCVVDQVIDARGATAIPAGKFVLSLAYGNDDTFLSDVAGALKPGDPMDIEISAPDARWNDVDCAVGSMYHILSGGQVTSDQETGSAAAPRTAVGVKADGSVIFYTIDGRQPGHSVGATTKMVAQRLAELGCTEGMLLDGGGSTSFISTYPDKTESVALNKPSEGNPRAVTNAIFLVSNLKATGTPGSLYVTPTDLVLLGGGSTQCRATCLDTGWMPMSGVTGGASWSANEGTVSDAGVYTAPKKSGVYTITAKSGGVSGSTTVTVYDTPDAIRLTNASTGKTVSSLDLQPGQTVDLNATATYKGLTLKADDSSFTWSTNVGTVNQNGVISAGAVNATGQLTIQAGSHTASIPVTVSAQPRIRLLADFEDYGDPTEDLFFRTAESPDSTFDFSNEAKYGFRSLVWNYVPVEGVSTLTLEEPAAITDADAYLTFWICGDNSDNTLFALFPRENGSLAAETRKLNFSGWKRISFAIPAEAMSFQGFKITGETGGTIYFDQMVLGNQTAPETAAPTVTMAIDGSTVKATITDPTTAALSPRQISLTLDGQSLPFTFAAPYLTATLPALGNSTHQITVTAVDSCGNRARASRLINGTAAVPFTDMTKHWAAPYVGRLAELNIVAGTGGGKFSPDSPITRGDFALLAARWMGLDLTAQDTGNLPFVDAASIPDWDRAAVAALYQMDIMRGTADKNGNLYALASSSITRAEAFTLLSRMQAKGWPEASLASFSDAKTVPDWARSAVASLVGQGIVSGSGGQLRPNALLSRAEVSKLLLCMW